MHLSEIKSDGELYRILSEALQPKGTADIVALRFTSMGAFDSSEVTAAIHELRRKSMQKALDPAGAALNPLERIAMRLLVESAGIDLR